jgi:putative adenylate-forming enzyme
MPSYKSLRIPVILFSYLRQIYLRRLFSTREKLETWQKKKIEKHLAFLQKKSPYYRRHLKGTAFASLKELPLISKAELMQYFNTINTREISRDEAFQVAIEAERSRDFQSTIRDVTVGLSSGTSGHRGIFMAAPIEQWMYAGTILAKVLPGFWRRKNRVAFFLRANSNLYTAVKSRALRFEYFDLFEPLEKQLKRLEEMDPTLVIAPPSLLRQIAEAQQAKKIHIEPKKIISVAEVLDPVDEIFISLVFGQRLHQIYQATEGFLATTCALGTLHLNEDLMHIEKEWLDVKSRKFQPVITDFSRKTQPIVRYRLNDILTEAKVPCTCGSVFTSLDFIEGRSDDLFRLPAKDRKSLVTIYPDFIRRAILLASDKITDYRVVQTSHTSIQVHFQAQGDAQTVQSAITHEFNQLASQLDFAIDKIDFSNEFDFNLSSGAKKLRRIENRV